MAIFLSSLLRSAIRPSTKASIPIKNKGQVHKAITKPSISLPSLETISKMIMKMTCSDNVIIAKMKEGSFLIML